MADEYLARLRQNQQRGSKPRCHYFMCGSNKTVADRLNRLVDSLAQVSPDGLWMPQGFDKLKEAQLHQATDLLKEADRHELATWWLKKVRSTSTTPSFDIASRCRIDGKPGLILVEGKAHQDELSNEAGGKRLNKKSSPENHTQIGDAIKEAGRGLAAETALPWGISRDDHYQLSNRFAWAWKLTQMGVPVVLVYLGFLKADEMKEPSIRRPSGCNEPFVGRPFTSDADWRAAVHAHARGIVPEQVWERSWACERACLIPLIRSVEQPLARSA